MVAIARGVRLVVVVAIYWGLPATLEFYNNMSVYNMYVLIQHFVIHDTKILLWSIREQKNEASAARGVPINPFVCMYRKLVFLVLL